MKDFEKDQLRRTVLDLICKGFQRYTQIEKMAVASCKPFITSNTFKAQFYGYLLMNGYIMRTARGKYALTDKGKNYLAVLSH